MKGRLALEVSARGGDGRFYVQSVPAPAPFVVSRLEFRPNFPWEYHGGQVRRAGGDPLDMVVLPDRGVVLAGFEAHRHETLPWPPPEDMISGVALRGLVLAADDVVTLTLASPEVLPDGVKADFVGRILDKEDE